VSQGIGKMMDYFIQGTPKMDKLKWCPFCKGKEIIIRYLPADARWYGSCLECGIETRSFGTRQELIDFWNTRATDDKEMDDVKCYDW